MGTILGIIFCILWVIATAVIFMWLMNRTRVVSLDGATGLAQGYLNLLVEAGIASTFIVGVPLAILYYIGSYIIGGIVIIGLIIGAVNYFSKNETTSQSEVVPPNSAKEISAPNATPETKRFCANCGEPITGNIQFCGKCGKKIKE